jgi:hypothetical protein
MSKSVNGGPKKAYTAPVLTVHGTVRELTQANQAGGKADTAVTGFKKRTAL